MRGYTVVAAICDEIAFWHSEDSANPDHEVLTALRGAMPTVPGRLLLCISSPYARRGAMWEAYRDHYGRDGDPELVWQADTRSMNPSVPQAFIEAEYEKDPAKAAAEYGAEFRTDLEAFVTLEALQRVVASGRTELAPQPGAKYVAFVDPTGGSQDSFALAIAHYAGELAVLDLVRERKPPLSPEGVIDEFAGILRTYRVDRVVGDHYAGEFPREQFRKRGIRYIVSERNKSDLYQALLPLINSQRLELLDDKRLITQLVNLERQTSRLGKDSTSHPNGAHDDIANAAAGALVVARQPRGHRMFERWPADQPTAPDTPFRAQEPFELGVGTVPETRTYPRYWRCTKCGAEYRVSSEAEDKAMRCIRCEPGWTWRDIQRMRGF